MNARSRKTSFHFRFRLNFRAQIPHLLFLWLQSSYLIIKFSYKWTSWTQKQLKKNASRKNWDAERLNLNVKTVSRRNRIKRCFKKVSSYLTTSRTVKKLRKNWLRRNARIPIKHCLRRMSFLKCLLAKRSEQSTIWKQTLSPLLLLVTTSLKIY